MNHGRLDGRTTRGFNQHNSEGYNCVALTSPPYENSKEIQDFDFRVNSAAELSENIRKGITKGNYCTKEARIRSIMKKKEGSIKDKDNIGNQQKESYLQAMSTVYGELAKVCTVLCTVTKDPTKAHKLRALKDDTNKLCASMGFERYNYIKARLFRTVEKKQATLTNKVINKKEYKGRVSFFKRLSLQSGNVAADCEDVQFFRLRTVGGGRLVAVCSPPYSEAQSGGGIAVKGYEGAHVSKQGKNQPDKVGDRCGYMKKRHGNTDGNIANLPDK